MQIHRRLRGFGPGPLQGFPPLRFGYAAGIPSLPRFHSEGYAMEELVAELGAAFHCSELGLPTDPRQDHAPYIASWLKVLKNDKRAIFTAAAKAQEAVDWMTKKTAEDA